VFLKEIILSTIALDVKLAFKGERLTDQIGPEVVYG
jgi:hypothetical protein